MVDKLDRSRRDFLKASSAALLGGGLAGCSGSEDSSETEERKPYCGAEAYLEKGESFVNNDINGNLHRFELENVTEEGDLQMDITYGKDDSDRTVDIDRTLEKGNAVTVSENMELLYVEDTEEGYHICSHRTLSDY